MIRIAFFFLLIPFLSFAQSLQLGGLQGTKPLLLTPSAKINQDLAGKSAWESPIIGLKPVGNTFEFSPQLQAGWKWVAAFNVDFQGKPLNIFYYDSWIGTTHKAAKSGGRKRNFDEDVTSKIASNAYHIAMQRKEVVENELFIFVWSPIKQKVQLQFFKNTIGINRTLSYDFEANEAKFIHVVVPPEEYSNIIWFPEKSQREVMDICQDWRFVLETPQVKAVKDFPLLNKAPFTSTQAEKVNLPHTWNSRDMFDQRAIKDSINVMEMFHRGVGWYQKKWRIPSSFRGRYLKVNFLGANQVTEVWFNGKYLGKNSNGYLDFHHDITPLVKFDAENELIVKVDNTFNYDIPPHTADYNFQGGIYREVQLIALNPVFVKRSLVATPSVTQDEGKYLIKTTLRSKAKTAQTLQLVSNVVNPYKEIIASYVRQVTVSADGTLEVVDSGLIKEPLLWSPDYPHLYQVFNTLYTIDGKTCVDQTFENFGFRKLEFHADKGFFINDQATKLKGVNIHQDIVGKGWAMSLADKRNDFIMVKKMGANFVRLSHYPHHPYVMHLCDSLGLMLWSEIPVVNTVGRDKFIANAVDMMERMILRDFNHPSILMWGVGNEYYRAFFTPEDSEYALKCTQAVAAKAKQLDPYRPRVQAQNDLVDNRIFDYTDIQGRNRYYGWYGAESYEELEKVMVEEHEKHPNWKLLISEYGAEAKYGYHVDKPVKFDHSLTYQLAFHRHYWEVIKKHPFLMGGTIWNMFDFASWAKIGNAAHLNKKGMATYDRRPKGIFYYYQSEWSKEPMVYIWEHTLIHRYGPPNSEQDLEVFSNCEKVELFLNGVSQGVHSKKEGYVWKVRYELGPNQLKAVGHHQGETVKWEMEIRYHHGAANKGYRPGKGSEDGY
jgi:beta-galactosidase